MGSVSKGIPNVVWGRRWENVLVWKVSFCRLGSLGLGNFTCNTASKCTRLALHYSYGIMISNLHWYCWWGRLDQCWSPWSCWSYNSTEVVQGLSLTFWILQTSKPWKPHYSWRGGGMGMGLGPMTIVSASLLWQQSWRQMLRNQQHWYWWCCWISLGLG